MKERIISYLKKYKESVITQAGELRNQPMPELTEELFSLFETTGNRIRYEAIYFLRRKYLAVFGLLSIMDRRPEDIHKLEKVMVNICEEECWALPAHVNRGKDKDWRITVDLFACETAQALSEIISILDQELSTRVKDLVRAEVFRRVLDPFYSSKVPRYWWEVCDNNWCAVCSGSIGSASIYLMKDEPDRLEQCLSRICSSLDHYIEGFAEDGACTEGLGYFTYGMTFYTGFAAQLYEYTNGRIDLLDSKKCARIASFQQKCYFSSGRTLSFSDGSSYDYFKVGLTCFLAMRYPEVAIPNMDRAGGFDADSCYRWMSIYRDDIWTRQYLKKLEDGEIEDRDAFEPRGQIVLPSAKWTICHGKAGTGIAAKGGDNGESHNHNDIGSFLYIYGMDMLLADLGAGEYTKEYFGQGRYRILCNSSLGHNVPLINGQTQHPGREYRSDRFETDGKGRTAISFAKAYEEGVIAKIERTLDFDVEKGALTVEDSFAASDRTRTITENLVTQFKPEIAGNQVMIKGSERACRITISNPEAGITCIRRIHHDHSGRETDVYLIQWNLDIMDGKTYCRIEIQPVTYALA